MAREPRSEAMGVVEEALPTFRVPLALLAESRAWVRVLALVREAAESELPSFFR